MATRNLHQPIGGPRVRGEKLTGMWIFLAICAVATAVVAHFARKGAVSPRIVNPDVVGVPARPVEFLWGISDLQWNYYFHLVTAVMMVVLVIVCAVMWARRPGSPFVLMVLASSSILWQDPIMNWAPYAVYNPQLWHFPEDWYLAMVSPSVEPFVVVGYAPFYFIAPFVIGIWLLRQLQARASSGSFVARHPLITLGLLLFVVGFIFDAGLELFVVNAGLYIYSQVIPFGSVAVGTTFQFPLIWESSLITLVMIPAGVLCYRDDSGRTQAEKLAQRFRLFAGRPVLTTFLVMAFILNVAYLCYGAGYVAIKLSGLATSVACPYPYPEAKTFDPQGYYEREGQKGPFFPGVWSTWASGQANGRPTDIAVKPNGTCR